MDTRTSFLEENEIKANLFVAKVMRITIIFLIVVLILNCVGIFEVLPKAMWFATILGVIALAIPTLLSNILKIHAFWVKYVTITLATLMVGILSICLNHHVVILYVYGIMLASTFYNKKLDYYTICVTTIILTICQFIGYYVDFTVDHNITDMKSLIVFTIIPRQIQLILMSNMIMTFNSRTSELLNMCIKGNEEQKQLFGQLKEMVGKSSEVSNGLAKSVGILSNVSEHSSETSKQAAENAEQVTSGVQETVRYLQEAIQSVMSMTSNLEKIAAESENVGELSQKVRSMSEDNGHMINEATHAMADIHIQTEACKEKIHLLGEKSQSIKAIVEAISGIAEQTNLLALNASIEAARAGEDGKGFGVVAKEVGKLADESQTLAQNIRNIIEEVTNETEAAVVAMNQSADTVQEGMQVIDKAKTFIEQTQGVSEQMNATIRDLAASIAMTAKESEKVSETVKEVNKINERNKEETNSITEQMEKQLKLAKAIVNSVKSIETMAEELLAISSEEQLSSEKLNVKDKDAHK